MNRLSSNRALHRLDVSPVIAKRVWELQIADVSELTKDGQRMDWLEQHYQSVDETSCRQTVKCGLLGVTFDAPYHNLRAAIDSALYQK
jgi:hypothetical protein